MCGIAGMVSFTRDLTDRQELADRMSETMSLRGPDEEGCWTDRHALLTFRRLAVIDPAGGKQPMVAEDSAGRVRVVLDYTGEIFNCAELRADLTTRGHHFRTHSDTEVVLRAYLEWGVECAPRLRGMFAFAVWDAAQSRLVLIRDRIGIYPLYYTEVDEGLLFGSEPKALFASGLCQPVADLTGLRELLGFTPTPGFSVFRGVREVIPGEVVSYDRDGLRAWRYWRLPAREHTDDFDTTVQTVRAQLEEIVRDQLVSDVPLSLMLSGGLDSSVMCSLATALGGRRPAAPGARLSNGTLHTFSADFAYNLTNFANNDWNPSPDGPFAELMSRRFGTDHRELRVTVADSTDRAEQLSVLAAMDRPTARLDMHVAMHRLYRMVQDSTTVTLVGDGSDELFGGYAWFHDPERVNGSTFPWFGSSYPIGMLAGMLDRQLVDELDLPAYVHDRYTEALAEVPHVDGASAHERRMRELIYLHMTRYLRVIIDRKDRMGASVAIEGRVPFCDHHLVEYVFNVPWAMKSPNGREKGLLRAAFADVLPSEVIDRRKSPFPRIQDPAYGEALRDQLRELVDDGSSPIDGLLDPAALKTVLTDPAAVQSPITRVGVEMAIMLDLWVREHGVTVAA
jgi:asparagine synthase (glutamine-hydrolysing)